MEEIDFFYVMAFVLPCIWVGMLAWIFKSTRSVSKKSTLFIIGWNVLFTLLLISISFFIGETYYRFFVDRTDSFGLSKISQRWLKRYYQPNNMTARDNIDYQLAIAPGKRRLTLIGDSFTAGHGIKNEDDRFGNILRNTYPELEVHIIAVNGINSQTELEILRKLDRDQYEFDIILLSYCLNDIDYLMPETQGIYNRIYDFEKTLGYFGTQSYLINTLKFKWFAIQDPDFLRYSSFVKKAYQEELWETQKKVLNRIRRFSEEKGRVFAVVTFPFLQVKMENYEFVDVHQKLNEFWKSENVLHLDLLETYEPYMGLGITVNKFDAHPNEFANKLAAGKIGAFLKTN